jgi:hypothetical protein
MGKLTLVIRDFEAMSRRDEVLKRFKANPDSIAAANFGDWPDPLNPIVRLEDDVETNYRIWPTSMSGSESEYEHAISFLPATPEAATVLTITIERLSTESRFPTRRAEAQSRLVEGPWLVRVPLAAN